MSTKIPILKKETQKTLITIIWYGKKEEQFPELITKENNIEKTWSIIRNNQTLLKNTRNNEIIRKLSEHRRIVSIINATPIRLLDKKTEKYIELYGTLNEALCPKCREKQDTITLLINQKKKIPECKKCSEALIPNVEPYTKHLEKTLNKALRSIMTSELIIVIGQSDVIEPGSHLPWIAKKIGGMKLIEINDEKTSLTPITDIRIDLHPVNSLKLLKEIIN